MLLKLEMKFADDFGDPIKTCRILKCHKQEGDHVSCGDPLFDVEVADILIPLHTASAWQEARRINSRLSEISERVMITTPGQPNAADNRQLQNFSFPDPKGTPKQVVALDKGILRRLYSREGTLQKLCDPMALLATDENDPTDYAADSVQLPSFRVVSRSLDFESVWSNLTNQRSGGFEGDQDNAEQPNSTAKHVIFWSEKGREHRLGIFAKGGCDLPTVKACRPLIARVLKGTCCIAHEGTLADGRNDQLLQTLRSDLPREAINEVVARLHLDPAGFEPRIFQKTFTVNHDGKPEEFPINVLILGSASDLERPIYRHREHGFLVDPGAGWLQNVGLIGETLDHLDAIAWFRRTFISAGQVTVEQYYENLTKVIQHVRQASGAHVLIFNNLTVDPNGLTHVYQFVKTPKTARRLEFKLALLEVSRKLNVPIVDVDRIVKRLGLRTMRDMNHFHPKTGFLIAEEIFGILQDLRVF